MAKQYTEPAPTPRAQYMRDYRSTPEGQRAEERQTKKQRAKRNALQALANAHPVEFAAILEAAMAEEGIRS